MVQGAFVRGAQDHAGSLAGLEGFLPTRSTQAPTVAGFQAAKAELRYRGRKIVATRFGKREKRGGHDGADRVATDVLSPGVAAAVSKKARHRVYRAEFKRLAEHVTGCVPSTGTITAVVSQHCYLRVGVADRPLTVMQEPAHDSQLASTCRWVVLEGWAKFALIRTGLRHPATAVTRPTSGLEKFDRRVSSRHSPLATLQELS
jgi:hypothetical protein